MELKSFIDKSNNDVLISKRVKLVDVLIDAKAIKEIEIRNLTVTTSMGTWKADEKSQARMANAIDQLSRKPVGTIKKWKMSDKSKVDTVQADIEEALDLAVGKLDLIVMA